MTQDINNPKKYTADEGKVFQRIHNGFTIIEKPYVAGAVLILGQILVDAEGNKLAAPIDDKIEYYQEIDAPIEETTEETPVEESIEETNNEENA